MERDEQNVFRGSLEDIERFDYELVNSFRDDVPWPDYEKKCWAMGDEAEASGQGGVASVYRFLAVILSFQQNFGDKNDPFRPLFILEDRRGFVPADLTEYDLEAVRALVVRVTPAILQGRLNDVLWIREHDHERLAPAADAYLKAALSLNTGDNCRHADPLFHRSLDFSKKLGREKERFVTVADAVSSFIESSVDEESGLRTCRLMDLAIAYQVGEPNKLADVASRIGQRLFDGGEHRYAREYWDCESRFLWLAKDETASSEAKLRAARTYVNEAEARLERDGSYMAAGGLLKEGIEALRHAGEDRERVIELRSRLAELQANVNAEMQTFEHGFDISEEAERAQEVVKQESLFEALKVFSFTHHLVSPDRVRKEVLELAKEFPLNYLIGAEIVDEKGRAQEIRPGSLDLESDPESLEKHMFSHAAECHWPLRARAFIDPARLQIYNDHHPTMADLVFLVRNNPFVPPEHEGIFLRGIVAGFNGDLLVASHLLVPQIENSVRYVLESNDVDVSNLEPDRTQPVKLWGGMLKLEEFAQIFGEELIFEFRGLLLEKSGHDLRNRIAHGFVSDGEAFSESAMNAWWLVVRICMMPILQRSEATAAERP